MSYRRKNFAARGFTLVELLTVIAIIGLLSAILVPATTSARVSARRAKTKVMFSQWAAAMELFRQDYGFYPAIDGGSGKVDAALFAGALTGKSLDGSPVTSASQLAGNSRGALFYSIAENELNEARTALIDAFGNSDIAVLYDRNGDGWLTDADGAAQSVRAAGSDSAYSPAPEDLKLSTGIRVGVIFYSAGNGSGPEGLVLSWK